MMRKRRMRGSRTRRRRRRRRRRRDKGEEVMTKTSISPLKPELNPSAMLPDEIFTGDFSS
jgi:hypothetical protein